VRPVLDADVVVVGAGVVGLSAAAALLRRHPGLDVVVLDKERAVGTHQSGRNSGVVHSGVYYRPGSAKARLVAAGRALLEQRCAEWGVPHLPCGKLIVATRPAELAALEELHRRGVANGVPVRRCSARAIREVEPHVRGLAGLHVRSTAVVDFGRVAAALAEELADRGAHVRTTAEVVEVSTGATSVDVTTATGETLRAGVLVNCAGLHSDRIARLAGARTDVTIVPFRGEYHELAPDAEHLVRGLVYPVPDPRWPFLGVHLTRMARGGVHVGPNAVLALGREAYEGGAVRSDLGELLTDPGLRRLARTYWRTGLAELVRSRSRRRLLADVRRLVPEVGDDDLLPAPAGIRAQAVRADGTLVDDFEFAASPRAVHVVNAPSPAATACLAIGEEVADRVVALADDWRLRPP
jgi:(S)-2-hydroxyglutarate dehydrogenase